MTSIDLPTNDDLPHEERLSSRRAYDGHILHVRVDDVRMPSGRKTVREVVEHPGSVIVLPVTVDDEVLFVRQYRYAVDERVIELPAGLIDPGEAPEVAARRELEEETGYEAGEIRLLGSAYDSPGYTRELSHFYVATGCLETSPFETNPDEPMELLRISRGDLPSLIRPGASPIRNAQTLLALNWFVRLEDQLLG
jgi:ADP-ribose pyrophosphatase